jgi:tetratricopeptide (TPR) repeat protein
MASCQACDATRQPNGEDLLECGGCNAVYCSSTCQEKDWESHKLECKAHQSHKCWICQKSGQKGDPVYRSCCCRGDKGFGHLQCFVDYAKVYTTAYQSCHMCKQVYRNEIQQVLAEHMNREATNLDEELRAKYMLAGSYDQSGNKEAAYKCLKEIIENVLRVVGEDHAFASSDTTAHTAISLANIAAESGHQEEAFGWLNCVDLGVQNGAIERSRVESGLLQGFATLYLYLGRYDKALPYAEHSVKVYERHNDERETPNKLEATYIVANIYSKLGQRDKAVAMNKEIYKQAKKKLGSSHPSTKALKGLLAQMENYWASGADPSDVQAQMTASKGRSTAIGFFHSIVNRKDLDGTPVEIRLFSREKRQYLVEIAGGNRSQLYVKPSNIILDTDTPVNVHGLQNAKHYNLKQGTTRDYSNKNGRHTVQMADTGKLITVKPENLLVQHQSDLVFDATRTLAQMLSDPNACC